MTLQSKGKCECGVMLSNGFSNVFLRLSERRPATQNGPTRCAEHEKATEEGPHGTTYCLRSPSMWADRRKRHYSGLLRPTDQI